MRDTLIGGGSRTYRGTSLEELLPRIRQELGPDAVVTHRREGIVGGIGGFFGRRCVEVEASLPEPAAPSFAARSATLAYGAAVRPSHDHLPKLDAAGGTPGPGEPADGVLGQALLDQAAPFADHLAVAERAGLAVELDPVTLAPVAVREPAPPGVEEEAALRAELGTAGLPAGEVDRLLRTTLEHLRPFEPDVPLRELARRALASSLQVRQGDVRTIALVGACGARTMELSALLCAGYADAGLAVGALALAGPRAAAPLVTATEDLGVEIAVANDLGGVPAALERLAGADLVVADAPPLLPTDPASVEHVAAALEALGAADVHLVVPARLAAADARRAHAALSRRVAIAGVVPCGVGEARPGAALGLALAHRLPVTWIAEGKSLPRVRPADPASLAAQLLP
jgi:hypothetical protein